MYTLCYQMCKIISACAGKRWLLTCIQHSRRLIRVQHTKHHSRASYHHALHKLLLSCSARKMAHVQYTKFDSRATHFVSHACFDSSHDKNWRMHVCSPHASVNLDVSFTVVIWLSDHPKPSRNSSILKKTIWYLYAIILDLLSKSLCILIWYQYLW